MTTQHTPGEWVVHNGGSVRSDVYTVAHCPCTTTDFAKQYGGVSPAEAEANARLIAAAPDLLAACKELHAWMTDHGCVPPCLTDAAAAIAKAEGGA